MKKNNRILISLLVVFFFTQIINSQKNNKNSTRSRKKDNSEEITKNSIGKFQEKIGLDDLQMVIVKNILLKYDNQKKLLRDQYGNSEVLMTEINDLNLTQDDELSKILTEDQIVILHEFQLEQRKEKEYQARNNYQNRNSNSSNSNRGRRRRY